MYSPKSPLFSGLDSLRWPCFAIPVSLLQSEAAITSAVIDLLNRLAHQGMAYAEIRFAPQLHTQQGLTQSQVVEAALAGLH